MIWWIWTAFVPSMAHIIDLNEWWKEDEEFLDVAWLGEGAWTGRLDNSGIGLK